jgi:Transthyretin-like protein
VAFGEYRLEFDTAHYFQEHGDTEFYPEVAVVFTVADSREHFHIPLLLSPFGYSTYKGT